MTIRHSFNIGASILMISLLCISCKKQDLPVSESTSVYGGSMDDFAQRVIASGDGGYIIAGRTRSNNGDITGNHGNMDALIMKVDAQGKKLWQKCYGGLEDDEAYSVVASSDGGFVFAGSTNSNDQFVKNRHYGSDFWIFKTDKSGNLLWQKTYGGNGVDNAFAITETPDKGFAVAGFVYAGSSNNGDVGPIKGIRDMWVIKLNQSGDLLWQTPLGGNNDEYATQILSAPDGTLTLLGTSSSPGLFATPNYGWADAFVAQLNDKGLLLWSLPFGGTALDVAFDVVQHPDNSLVLVGMTGSNNGTFSGVLVENYEAFMMRINPQHKIDWIKTFGGVGNDAAYSLVATSDGGYVFTGETTTNSNRDVPLNKGRLDMFTLKTDANGVKIWAQTRGGSDNDEAGRCIAEIPGRGYVAVGYAKSNDGDVTGNRGGEDVMVSTFKN